MVYSLLQSNTPVESETKPAKVPPAVQPKSKPQKPKEVKVDKPEESTKEDKPEESTKEDTTQVPSEPPAEKKIESKDATDSVAVSDLDSYEARREARRRAREKRMKEALEGDSTDGSKKLTYKEKKELERKKQQAEVKQKWSAADNANSSPGSTRK